MYYSRKLTIMDDDFFFYNELEDDIPEEYESEEFNLWLIFMGEPEAIQAINKGYVEIENKIYNIIKHPKGWCDGCCFYAGSGCCPALALKICCTGGVIFSPAEK